MSEDNAAAKPPPTLVLKQGDLLNGPLPLQVCFARRLHDTAMKGGDTWTYAAIGKELVNLGLIDASSDSRIKMKTASSGLHNVLKFAGRNMVGGSYTTHSYTCALWDFNLMDRLERKYSISELEAACTFLGQTFEDMFRTPELKDKVVRRKADDQDESG